MNPYLRPATKHDFEFAFAAKKEALGPHVSARWEWDDEYQRAVHELRWSEKPWSIIMLNEASIGTVSIQNESECARFGEFYLLAGFRGRGLGSIILGSFCGECDAIRQSARLEYLKWNPVGSLYKRHGFEVVSENEIHYFMLRAPQER